MAHEITERSNGFAEMAFSGQTPWHGLGQHVEQGATIEVWQRQAGLDWSANRAMVQYAMAHQSANAVILDHAHSDEFERRSFSDKHVLYRSDNGAPLSVVGSDYKAVQPAEILEFFRDLTEAGGWHIHTAGSLQGGRKIWALAHNHTEGLVAPGDRVRGNLLLATSLDGSMRTTAAMTAIRVVCANTLRLALSKLNKNARADGTRDVIEISHRSVFDADAVKKGLGVAVESFHEFTERARVMAETPVAQEEAREILRSLFGQPTVKLLDAPIATTGGSIDGSDFAQLLARPALSERQSKVTEHRNIPKVLELFNGTARGADSEGSRGTRWGLFNSVTEFIDHQAGRSDDTRLLGAWFGKGHDIKSQALELLAPMLDKPANV